MISIHTTTGIITTYSSIELATIMNNKNIIFHRTDGAAVEYDTKSHWNASTLPIWWLHGKSFRTKEDWERELIKYKLNLL
jgi:hypothetical protein